MFMFGKPKVSEVSVVEVKRALDTKEKMILLDVRNVSEFERGRIEKSINVPLFDLESDIERVVPDKSQKIYVYCLSGSRSKVAVEEMMKKGYTNVHNVANGLLAWRAHRYPVS
jgi:rhodanese-related sulfurtransferase